MGRWMDGWANECANAMPKARVSMMRNLKGKYLLTSINSKRSQG